MIHGIPEIVAYFIGALAGGIISVAIIRKDLRGDGDLEDIARCAINDNYCNPYFDYCCSYGSISNSFVFLMS